MSEDENGALPEPLVAADVDLKNFPFTPMFRARLFGSSFHANATDAEWRAGVTLWLKSWDQVPAGTLPNDEVALCRLAELGRDIKAWHRVKAVALHGWFRCSDNRLHHKVVAEGINTAWTSKQSQHAKTAAARAAKAKAREAKLAAERAAEAAGDGDGNSSVAASVTEPVTGSVTESVTDNVTSPVTGSNRTEQNITEDSDANASGAGAPADPVKELWDRALAILGKGQRTLLGKLRKEHGDPAVLSAIVACDADHPSDPVAFFIACCKRHSEQGHGRRGSGDFERKQREGVDDRERGKAIMRAFVAGDMDGPGAGAGFTGRGGPIIDLVPESVDPGHPSADRIMSRSGH
jgi:uncharacterized protein YdaU (DUF1376 family)